MCGRISQFRDPLSYTEYLGLTDPLLLFDSADRRPGYNLAPGTHPLAIHADQTVRAIHWGYRPDWARDQHLPQTINARADAAHDAPYFSDLWETGRVLVPADGWFEWRFEAADAALEHEAANEATRETTSATQSNETSESQATKPAAIRQPYFVHLKTEAPMYLAALSNVRGNALQTGGMGLVIVTAIADKGLVDIHDRRPLAFAPDAARRWLDPASTADELAQLTRSACLAAARFRWHKVSTDVERTTADEQRLIEPLH